MWGYMTDPRIYHPSTHITGRTMSNGGGGIQSLNPQKLGMDNIHCLLQRTKGQWWRGLSPSQPTDAWSKEQRWWSLSPTVDQGAAMVKAMPLTLEVQSNRKSCARRAVWRMSHLKPQTPGPGSGSGWGSHSLNPQPLGRGTKGGGVTLLQWTRVQQW